METETHRRAVEGERVVEGEEPSNGRQLVFRIGTIC